jgi:hypothetical protein
VTRVRWALVLVILVVATSLAAPPPPRAALTKSGAIELAVSADVLASAEVKKQLRSGLTTAFMINVSSGGVDGGARIEIRYDLWNEKYVIHTIDVSGREQTASAANDEDLAHWWRQTPPLVLGHSGRDATMSVRLRVLPFSAREQEETQRWLSRSLDDGRDRDSPSEKQTNAKLLEIIMGTSIKRRPILEYRWTVPVARQPQ